MSEPLDASGTVPLELHVNGERGRVLVSAVVGAEEPGFDRAEMTNRRFGG